MYFFKFIGVIIITLINGYILNLNLSFEEMNFEPLINHETGKSFPSKHATSAMVIALALCPLFPIFGIIMILNVLFYSVW